MALLGEYGAAIGAQNQERVRAWLAAHLGGTNGECAKALGLNVNAVGRHVRRIRAEWLAAEQGKSEK